MVLENRVGADGQLAQQWICCATGFINLSLYVVLVYCVCHSAFTIAV